MTRRGLGPYRDPRWNSRSPGGTPNPAPDRRDDPRLTRGSVERPSRAPWPSTLIWRWRWELGLVVGAVLLLWAGWLATGAWVLVIAPIVVSALTLVPPWQRRMARQHSAITVQHRIRGGWSASSLYGPDGEVPLLLWTRVVADGERIYLWSPPSLTANAFRAESARLAKVCRSQSIRVQGHSRFTRVVILDVVRRGTSPVATVVPAVMMIPRPRQRQEV